MKRPKPLATRLRRVVSMLRRDRQSLIESERWPGRTLDPETREAVAGYDYAIKAVKEAIQIAKEKNDA